MDCWEVLVNEWCSKEWLAVHNAAKDKRAQMEGVPHHQGSSNLYQFGRNWVLGNVVISKNFLRTRKIMVMHSNERGECCPRTLVDRQRKRNHNAVDVVVRLHDPTDQVPNVRHLRVLHTFSSMTSLELRSSRVLRESFVSTTAW